jgi:hypothetical protein
MSARTSDLSALQRNAGAATAIIVSEDVQSSTEFTRQRLCVGQHSRTPDGFANMRDDDRTLNGPQMAESTDTGAEEDPAAGATPIDRSAH